VGNSTSTKTVRSSKDAPIARSGNPRLSISPPKAQVASDYDLRPSLPFPNNNLTSTRPAPLETPKGPLRESDGSVTLKSRASYLYRLGKAYLTFYKTGFMNIWSNYKEFLDLRTRLGGIDIHECVKYGRDPKITRREYQLYLRTNHDLKKLIPFGLVFAICGEFTPLVVLALGTAVVPYTCRIPQQVKKDLEKTLSRVRDGERIIQSKGAASTDRVLAYIHGSDRFGIERKDLPLRELLWRYWIEPRFKRRVDDIICDAILISREGGPSRLEPDELYQFAVKMRKAHTIKQLIDYYRLGIQSHIPEPDIARTEKEVEVFIDDVRQSLTYHEKKDGYKPWIVLASPFCDGIAISNGGEPAPLPKKSSDL
jgi:hypothetical protein